MSAAEIERAEFASTVDALVPSASLYLLQEANPMVVTRLLAPSTMSDNEARETLKACPTFGCRYKLLAALRSHKSTVRENDLWDLQHVASATPYVDCLACDGGTRHICTQLAGLDDKYGTKIISKPREILEWVQS